MVTKLISRNQTQSVNGETKEGRVTNANTGLYTVPTGKKARITSAAMNLDAVGADATYALAIKRGVNFRPVGEHVIVNKISTLIGELNLIAGDILTNIGDAGSTNGTCDTTCTVTEFPA